MSVLFTVAVVDDEVFIREGLIKTVPWQEMDCCVIGQADNSVDALELIEQMKPDIAIIDIIMPGYNGIELAKRVQARNLVTKLIILTGYSDFTFAQSAIKYGVSDYILKPSDIGEIQNVIYKVERAILLEKGKKNKDEQLSGIVNNNCYLLQQNILKKLLLNETIKDMEQVRAELQLLGVNLESFAVLTLNMDPVIIPLSNIDRSLNKCMHGSMQVFKLKADEGELVILFYWDCHALRENEAETVIMRVIDLIQKEVLKLVCKKATVGISSIHAGIESLNQAYNESKMGPFIIIEDCTIGSVPYKSEVVYSCLQYMYEHFCEKMSMADIARRVHMSEGYLFRCFKKETGYTFLEVLEQYRIQNAKKLLRSTNYRIYEVANRTGFFDTKYFNFVFKKLTGLTPSEYRDFKPEDSINKQEEGGML